MEAAPDGEVAEEVVADVAPEAEVAEEVVAEAAPEATEEKKEDSAE